MSWTRCLTGRGIEVKKTLQDRIEIKQGDITQLAVDVIVNAANNSLLGGGGVDGAIHRAAGPELLAECRRIGGCPTGQARLTSGYRLPATYVIHTVGPIYGQTSDDAGLLSACYFNSLTLADAHNIRSIAFPAISCGVYGYPIESAARIAIHATIQYLAKNDSIQKVIFALFSNDHRLVYEKVLSTI